MKSKTFGIIFLILWTICCIVNVAKNMAHYKIGDWIVILFFILIPYIICSIIHLKKTYTSSKPIPKTDYTQIKENSNTTYINTQNLTLRADGKHISDKEVPRLIERDKQKAVEVRLSKSKCSNEEQINQFILQYGKESQQYCNRFESLSRAADNESNLDKKIELLYQTIKAFEQARQWHYNHSVGAKMYFYEIWECMHNSHNSKFNWVDSVKSELTFQLAKRDTIIPWIINNAHIGFLQTKIYNAFPKIDRTQLRKVIDETVKNFNLSKTKKGSTYFIKTK